MIKQRRMQDPAGFGMHEKSSAAMYDSWLPRERVRPYAEMPCIRYCLGCQVIPTNF